jgi:hypothetical protein
MGKLRVESEQQIQQKPLNLLTLNQRTVFELSRESRLGTMQKPNLNPNSRVYLTPTTLSFVLRRMASNLAYLRSHSV